MLLDPFVSLLDSNSISSSSIKNIKIPDPLPLTTLTGHSNYVNALALLEDDSLASASEDKSIKIWNLQTGQCTKTLTGHSNAVYVLAVLKDGFLASAGGDNSIKIWNLQTGQCTKTLTGHSNAVYALVVLKDGSLASASLDKSIKIWNLQTGQCVKNLTGHSHYVIALAVLNDGSLASASWDKSIKLWNMAGCPLSLKKDAEERVKLFAAVLKNGKKADSQLTSLDFSGVELGENSSAPSLVFLTKLITQHKTLTQLDFSNCGLNDTILEKFLLALFDNHKLQSVKLEGNDLNSDSKEKVNKILKRNQQEKEGKELENKFANLDFNSREEAILRPFPQLNPENIKIENKKINQQEKLKSSSQSASLEKLEDIDIPEKYRCSISAKIMYDPVVTTAGNTYEREAITQWLQDHNKDPLFGEILESKSLVPNNLLRGEIREFLEKHQALYSSDEIYIPKKMIDEASSAITQKNWNKLKPLLSNCPALLINPLFDNHSLPYLICKTGSKEMMGEIMKMLGETRISGLVEAQQNKGAVLFQLAVERFDLATTALIVKTLGWNKDDIEQQFLLGVMGRKDQLVAACLELEEQERKTNNVSNEDTLLAKVIRAGQPESKEVVSYLLEKHKVDLKWQDKEQNTLLHLAVLVAAENKQHDVVIELVRRGVGVKIKNKDNLRPLGLAKKLKATELEKVMSNELRIAKMKSLKQLREEVQKLTDENIKLREHVVSLEDKLQKSGKLMEQEANHNLLNNGGNNSVFSSNSIFDSKNNNTCDKNTNSSNNQI